MIRLNAPSEVSSRPSSVTSSMLRAEQLRTPPVKTLSQLKEKRKRLAMSHAYDIDGDGNLDEDEVQIAELLHEEV